MKMGIAWEDLQKSVMTELAAAYGIPFVVIGISSFFSVGALTKMMFVDLTGVNVVSVGIVFGILVLWYGGGEGVYVAECRTFVLTENCVKRRNTVNHE